MSDNDSDGYVPPSPAYFPDSPEPFTPGSPVGYSSNSTEDTDYDKDEEENNDTPSEFANSPEENDSDEKKGSTRQDEGEEEWEAYEDDSGRTYYYNPSTGETQWEKPARYKHVGIPKDDEASVTRSPAKEEEEGEAADDEDENIAVEDCWIEYQDEEGRTYYYNSKTGTTQWERPDVASTIHKDETILQTPEDKIQDDGAFGEKQNLDEVTPTPEDDHSMDIEKEIVEEPAVIVIDPVTAALDALKAMDAILEPSSITHVTDLVTNLGPNEGYAKAIQCLSNSFHGQTAICGLLCSWIRTLACSSSSSSSQIAASTSTSATQHLSLSSADLAAMEAIRDIVEKVIHGIVIEKYSKEKDENILRLRKREVQFLEDMMDSDRWRRLLIDLSTKHKDSALLMFCLKSMSRRGHHREIARHNQSDYFGVFDSMLNYELSIIGKPWEEDLTSTIGKNLLETCTSTEYTYLHAMEAVEDLRGRSTKMCASNGMDLNDTEKKGLQRAVRKWDRLKEDLEDAMLMLSNGNCSSMARKRRINLALTVSELHQRQRRRFEPAAASSVKVQLGDANQKDKWKDTIDSSVLNLIKRHCAGMPFDLLMLNKLIKPVNDDLISSEQHGTYVGQCLISHPTAIDAILSTLYKSGGTVVKSQDLKEKCAALLAHAVLAARKDVCLSSAAKIETESTKKTLSEVQREIIDGSELCDQVGNMVTFIVLDDENAPKTSVGINLSVLCIKSAPVAKGVIIWATDLFKGSEFCASAAYPTLTPCILSLVRVIVAHHPFTREDAMALTFIVLFEHPVPEDISYQKVESLRKQCLRLLLFLCCLGQALNVLYELSGRLKKGSTAIDSSLIRYFIGGCLEIFNPPFSISFVKCVSMLLLSTPCIEALCSASFEKGHMTLLQKMIKKNVALLSEKAISDSFTQNERHTISSLTQVYGKITDVEPLERT